MAKKLHIDNSEEDHFETNLAMLVAFLGCLSAAYAFTTAPEHKSAEVKKAEIPHTSDPVVKELLDERSLVSTFKSMSTEELQKREWSKRDRVAVYRFGPRNASEVVCTHDLEKISTGTLEPDVRLELEKTLDRRSEFGPWTCLVRAYYKNAIGNDAIKKEVGSFTWQMTHFTGNDRITMSVVDEFRTTRDRPESDHFYRWLRRCALNDRYQPHVSCRKLLSQIAPAHGTDMIEMFDHQLADPEHDPKDYPMYIATLGRIARNGQPLNWNVKESTELPDYNADIKIGAVLSICRFMQGDETEIAASEQLAKTAEVKLRANDKNTVIRWYLTCSILFGGDDRGENVSPFMVTRASEDAAQRFDIGFLREVGVCKTKVGYPTWYCASEAFIDRKRPVRDILGETFVRTSYIEFIDEINAEFDRQQEEDKAAAKTPN